MEKRKILPFARLRSEEDLTALWWARPSAGTSTAYRTNTAYKFNLFLLCRTRQLAAGQHGGQLPRCRVPKLEFAVITDREKEAPARTEEHPPDRRRCRHAAPKRSYCVRSDPGRTVRVKKRSFAFNWRECVSAFPSPGIIPAPFLSWRFHVRGGRRAARPAREDAARKARGTL